MMRQEEKSLRDQPQAPQPYFLEQRPIKDSIMSHGTFQQMTVDQKSSSTPSTGMTIQKEECSLVLRGSDLMQTGALLRLLTMRLPLCNSKLLPLVQMVKVKRVTFLKLQQMIGKIQIWRMRSYAPGNTLIVHNSVATIQSIHASTPACLRQEKNIVSG